MHTVDRYVSVHYVSTCSYALIDDNFEFALVLLTKLDEKHKDSHHIAPIISTNSPGLIVQGVVGPKFPYCHSPENRNVFSENITTKLSYNN